MKRYRTLAILTLVLAVYHAHKGDTALTVLYSFALHWYRDWIIREEADGK